MFRIIVFIIFFETLKIFQGSSQLFPLGGAAVTENWHDRTTK
jgi:hypothetical protein